MIVRVRGRSMIPTLHPGDFLWVRLAQVAIRGDIALIRMRDGHVLIKRVVGLPAETLEIRQGRLMVDGRLLPEPYVAESAFLQPKPDQTWILTPETYLVLGDARDDSLDSRRFGPVERKDILGIATRRIWPPKFKL